MPVVVVTQGERVGLVASLVRKLVVGRGRAAHLRLGASSVSRAHCSFERQADGGVALRDLQSLNGTFLNGARVTCEPLSSGDRIRVGPVTLTFLDDGGELGEAASHDAAVPGCPAPCEAETRADLSPLSPARGPAEPARGPAEPA